MLRLMDHAKIGARLREARERAGLTQVQVQEKIGINQGTLSKIEKGRAALSLERAVALSQLLRLPLSELTRRAGKKAA